ncbi:MAG: cation transporter [Defluviitaleaceae bacterium]|nr:cation transporter [Defluviitaleaceae bacterium]
MERIILEVTGMSCAHCEKAVKNALEDLGVKNANASAKKNIVEVTFDPQVVNQEQIKSEIKELGYYV